MEKPWKPCPPFVPAFWPSVSGIRLDSIPQPHTSCRRAARDATEPAPDDSDTGPDLGIALSGIAADLDKLAVYVTALDTDARLKVFDDHFDALNDVSRKLQRTIKALRAAQKIRAQEKEG